MFFFYSIVNIRANQHVQNYGLHRRLVYVRITTTEKRSRQWMPFTLHGVIGVLTFTPVVFILQYSENQKIWILAYKIGMRNFNNQNNSPKSEWLAGMCYDCFAGIYTRWTDWGQCQKIAKLHQYLKFSMMVCFGGFRFNANCVTFVDCACTAMWLSCYDVVCLLAC